MLAGQPRPQPSNEERMWDAITELRRQYEHLTTELEYHRKKEHEQ